jgi:predicted short-subunit dehydrogenase-like oxidoreductase (DUF2520 family)
MDKRIKSIGIIGCGNLGTHLALHAQKLSLDLCFVYNRTPQKAILLANSLGTKALKDLSEITSCDVLFLTVPDEQIQQVTQGLSNYPDRLSQTMVVHCSGATNLESLNQFSYYGVFYPLQTFTINKIPDWQKIPIFVEGNTEIVAQKLTELAHLFSDNVKKMNSKERLKLHCGAVFVSNFVHALAHIALNVSKQTDFQSIFFPLINEAVQKLQYYTPEACITGPAKRKDIQTINKHLDIIEEGNIREIYHLFTEYIQKKL